MSGTAHMKQIQPCFRNASHVCGYIHTVKMRNNVSGHLCKRCVGWHCESKGNHKQVVLHVY